MRIEETNLTLPKNFLSEICFYLYVKYLKACNTKLQKFEFLASVPVPFDSLQFFLNYISFSTKGGGSEGFFYL